MSSTYDGIGLIDSLQIRILFSFQEKSSFNQALASKVAGSGWRLALATSNP
jgi:hypothetical protein